MTLAFEPISLEKQQPYRERLKNSLWEASDYSFINLWGWAREYGLEWAWDDDLVWIRQSWPTELFWAPVGKWEQADWADRLRDRFSENSIVMRVPEPLIRHWKHALKDRIAVTATEEHWDYLYSVQDLIELKGNRYHKKKNLLNQFLRKYDHAYQTLTPDLIHHALEMQEDWCVWRDCESDETLASENRAISRVMAYWDDLDGIFGGAVIVEDEMAAFTVAEQMNDETVLIHFEKGIAEYKGIYQAVNQMFLAHNPHLQRVNREQDMGEEGLRKSKRSYHPVDFVRKYKVTFA
ncbi:DUF2156 domain-containing protein [Desulfococcus sp.]|uniref:DUF2156 domain-containing protein n=1 Tax=Desulfococcus sp. TaxID=2025834 RepID=UPI003D13F3FA